MKILVTGGCGFIGSNFIRYMLDKYPDHSIVNLDKLTYAGNKDSLADIEDDSRYEFIKGDICDSSLVNDVVARVDAIINFAAESHVDRSILTPDEFVQTNVAGVNTLLMAVLNSKQQRFLQVSTDEVYGSREEGSFIETDMLEPSSPYSAAKAGGDLIAQSYFVTYGLPVTITRSSNNFGPYQFPEKLIPLFVTNLINGNKIPLYGDGQNVRDWLYVLDNCEAIDKVFHEGNPGEIYNIGAGNEHSNIEITNIILNTLGLDDGQIEYVPDRMGHDRRYSIDCAKVRSLGWAPRQDFESALIETIGWYQNNETWWKPLKERAVF